MSDLELTRDHARRMARQDHATDCEDRQRALREAHQRAVSDWASRAVPFEEIPERPAPCRGCLPDNDRALWTQIADEIDRYLDGQTDDEQLDLLAEDALWTG